MKSTYQLQIFEGCEPLTKNQRKTFDKWFDERLKNSLYRAGCRTRADVILLIVWHLYDFAMTPGVGHKQISNLIYWWTKQPECQMQWVDEQSRMARSVSKNLS
jgi:hypothetical protein